MPETPEDLLQSLAETPPYTYPREVLAEMISRLDEMVPHLLADLERIGANPEAFNEERDGLRLVFAAFLLAQAREVRAFQPLVSLLSLPEDQINELWGDLVSQDMGRILASVFDGDEASLRGLIENPAHAEYVRGAAAIHAVEALVRIGRIPLASLERYYRELLESKLEREPSIVWDALGVSVGEFGFVSLLPAIKWAFDEGLCDPFYDTFENISKSAKTWAKSSSMSSGRSHLSLVSDTFADTEWWACFQPVNDPGEHQMDDSKEHWSSEEEIAGRSDPALVSNGLREPYIRETPKTGRNDPCPCGSGKKFKKCCG